MYFNRKCKITFICHGATIYTEEHRFSDVENYPQLKSDSTMVTAMQTYNEVEEHISAARRFYNSAVLELNNAVEIFPSSMVAVMCGIEQQEFFQANDIDRKDVNAADYLK